MKASEHTAVCACGHDHSHHHEDSYSNCEHEHHHEHHHEHSEGCTCGHAHEHHHEHSEGCSCGHEHEHHHERNHEAADKGSVSIPKGQKPEIYLIENLDCANCAAKVEAKLNTLPELDAATITFATKQLRLYAKDQQAALPLVKAVIAELEPNVVIRPYSGTAKQSESLKEEEGNPVPVILTGAVLFVLGEVFSRVLPEQMGFWVSLAVFLFAYLLLGKDVLLTAGKNILRGQVFDENFLMSIATIGAICIGEYPEAVGVMLFYRVGEYFEDRAVERSRNSIMEALDLRPETVTLENGAVIPAEDAQIDDLLLVRPGDRIPLDGVVAEGESFVDTSAVTGEPVPVSVRIGDRVLSGCMNTNGLLKLKVTAPLSESMVTRILESVESAAASKPTIDRFITRFARVYTPIVVILAVLVALVPGVVTGNWIYWVKTACTFLVISCPCALVLSVPLAFFSGIGAASGQKILFKGGAAMEALKTVRAVALDKTGTITMGNFVLQSVEPMQGVAESELLAIAAGCEAHSTHPIARSILVAAEERGIVWQEPNQVSELAGHGIQADGVLCGNRKLMETYVVTLPELSAAPGCTEVLLAGETGYLGRLLISDTIKPEAAEAVRQIKQAGLVPVMLTGDSGESADAVAAAVGIEQVKSKLLPGDKQSALQEIRAQYGPVLFVGDGINDAPVLAGADVGAAMGSGADAAIEAADVVFMTSQLSAVPKAIDVARKAVVISRQNVVFALVIKALIMLLGVIGFANMWLAVFADTGVAMLCILNSVRLLRWGK